VSNAGRLGIREGDYGEHTTRVGKIVYPRPKNSWTFDRAFKIFESTIDAETDELNLTAATKYAELFLGLFLDKALQGRYMPLLSMEDWTQVISSVAGILGKTIGLVGVSGGALTQAIIIQVIETVFTRGLLNGTSQIAARPVRQLGELADN